MERQPDRTSVEWGPRRWWRAYAEIGVVSVVTALWSAATLSFIASGQWGGLVVGCIGIVVLVRHLRELALWNSSVQRLSVVRAEGDYRAAARTLVLERHMFGRTHTRRWTAVDHSELQVQQALIPRPVGNSRLVLVRQGKQERLTLLMSKEEAEYALQHLVAALKSEERGALTEGAAIADGHHERAQPVTKHVS